MAFLILAAFIGVPLLEIAVFIEIGGLIGLWPTLGLVVLTCISIAGRAFVPFDIGIGPIRGIYDMTEIGMAAAIFAFLPWAQLREAHARVDLFLPVMPKSLDRLLELIFNIAMFAVALVGTWRLYLGMQDKLSFGETTLIAQIPKPPSARLKINIYRMGG